MSDWISLELRNFVRQRARGRCEYCQLHDDDAGLRHQPDHIVALKHRGVTIESNLAYSCAMCNSFKGSRDFNFRIGMKRKVPQCRVKSNA